MQSQDEAERIDARFDEVAAGLTSIREAIILDGKELAAMRVELTGAKEQLAIINKLLVIGNGHPPLTSRVAVLEAQQKRGKTSRTRDMAIAGGIGAPGFFAFVKAIADFFQG